ncbi:MAG: response regulator [Methanobacteriota archaeon]
MSHEKILIIENDEKVAGSLEKTLISYDYTVAGVASSGKSALSMAQEMPVDLVLMDGVLNGPHDVVTTANGILSRIDIPIIYLIPHDNKDLIFLAKNRLPNGFLTKPIDEKKLLSIIRRALIYHAWGTIPTENESQCYTRYEEVVCTFGKENDSSLIRNKMPISPLLKAEWMAY